MRDDDTTLSLVRGLSPAAAWSLWLLVLSALAGIGLWFVESPEEASAALVLVTFAPLLATLAVAPLSRPGLRGIWRHLTTWRADPRLWALALLLPFALVVAVNLAHTATGGPPPPGGWWALPPAAVLAGTAGPMISGALEEPAWRGFAQPLLEERTGWITASVIVGLVWATWHLWPLLTPGGLAEFTPLEPLHTCIRLVSASVVYGWLFRTTRSLPLVIVAHMAHNAAVAVLPVPDLAESPRWALLLALAYLVAAVAVVAFSQHRPQDLPERSTP
ncbi:CPBP family intramembrane glutamic endopeptidase [Nocardiopsis ganjiahuensis]|uniref:CPBP family intramembrane glutamic endopeptidase n=1 Tax=Nocardiopsis ganjiahuensis TaxID=239984 RepID=UPI000344E3DF|nr:type II CAAX endopeptidase family protein [Nocardiopsis ganjiahuensis]